MFLQFLFHFDHFPLSLPLDVVLAFLCGAQSLRDVCLILLSARLFSIFISQYVSAEPREGENIKEVDV